MDMLRRRGSRAALWPLLVLLQHSVAFQTGAHQPAVLHKQLGPAGRHRRDVRCGPRIRVVSVGKPKEAWLSSAIDEYAKRLRSTIELELVWVKDDAALQAQVAKAEEPCIILDERGSVATSVEFASRLYSGLEDGGSRLSFFIGGAEGLPPELKADRSRLCVGPRSNARARARILGAHLCERLRLCAAGSPSRSSPSRTSTRGSCWWSRYTAPPRSGRARATTKIETYLKNEALIIVVAGRAAVGPRVAGRR